MNIQHSTFNIVKRLWESTFASYVPKNKRDSSPTEGTEEPKRTDVC